MLVNLHVKNLALIEEEEVDFSKGFNVLTGETGAGKSIILGSVNLALGAKLSSDIIRSGSENALIELTFSLSDDEATKIKELGYDADNNEILLQRKIQPGKSISRLNGETISLSQLKEVSEILLEMYGQHEHQSLLKSKTYEKMLDEYAGEEVKENQLKLSSIRKRYKELLLEYEKSNINPEDRKRQADLLEFEINEIESASLKIGEDDELEDKFRFMNNAKRIEEAALEAHNATGYDLDSGAGTMIGTALSRIKSVASFDERLDGLTSELTEIESLLNDFNRSLSDYIGDLEFDESDYYDTEVRLNLINNLKGKYNASIERIIELLDEKKEEINKLNDYDSYLLSLEGKIKDLRKEMLDICKRISASRTEASVSLQKRLKETLLDLNFQDVRLKIEVKQNEDNITDTGYDDIEFLISLNVGEELKPIRSIASGGELSRIMLAIKSIFADKEDVSTLIFDEIDTGISGKTAYMVAEKIKELSMNHQVICITHLPQIASKADSHYLIEKNVVAGRSVTEIKRLSDDESVYELARMLASDEINEAALENARELKRKK